MDFCDNETNAALFTPRADGSKIDVVTLYKYLCPPLILGSFVSVVINSVLVIVGHLKTSNKSPILILSLNLASTDTMASLLVGLGFIFNAYLPIVFGVSLDRCPFMVFEIVRISALVASVLHLLALAFVHYKGIVKPLHYRVIGFCSHHVTRSIHMLSISCWILPIVLFTIYFFSIPCQAFQSTTCDYQFMFTFRFRLLILFCFASPLVLMSVLYIKIFALIKQHDSTHRSFHGNEISLNSAGRPLGALASAEHHDAGLTLKLSRSTSVSVKWNKSWWSSKKEKFVGTPVPVIQVNDDKLNQDVSLDGLSADGLINGTSNSGTISAEVTAPATHSDTSEPSVGLRSHRKSVKGNPQAPPQGHAKALTTTLIILGTYLVCWMPAVLFLALTCVDGCPFPILEMDIKAKLIVSFVTNTLVVLKAIVDPFIYAYRMKDVKLAVREVFCRSSGRRSRSNTPSATTLSVRSSAVQSNHVSPGAASRFRSQNGTQKVQREVPPIKEMS